MIAKYAILSLFIGLSTASCGGAPKRGPSEVEARRPPSVASASGRIEVHVTSIPSVEGRLLLVLYDESTYLREGASVSKTSVAVVAPEMRVTLEHVPSGRYLIVATHDANGNGALDTSVIGLPTEAYGFSRDAQGAFGPPSFDDAAFDFDGKTAALDIQLR